MVPVDNLNSKVASVSASVRSPKPRRPSANHSSTIYIIPDVHINSTRHRTLVSLRRGEILIANFSSPIQFKLDCPCGLLCPVKSIPSDYNGSFASVSPFTVPGPQSRQSRRNFRQPITTRGPTVPCKITDSSQRDVLKKGCCDADPNTTIMNPR